MPSSSGKKNATRPQKAQAGKNGGASREKSVSGTMIEQTRASADYTEIDAILDTKGEILLEREPHSDIEIDDALIQQGADINLGGKRLGGPTGGDLESGGGGPAIGETHPANDDTADHYGSRAETQAALEGRIANLNTRQLKGW